MINFKTTTMLFAFFAFTFIFSLTANAQKYKIAADTLKLNKEYAGIALDVSKLNVKLVEAQNKTNGYKANSASTAQYAVNSAQQSKTDASTATNGNLSDAKTAMKQAKKANNQAKDAKNAKDDENDNLKTIRKLGEKIADKQQLLADLDKQRAAINALPAVTIQ